MFLKYFLYLSVKRCLESGLHIHQQFIDDLFHGSIGRANLLNAIIGNKTEEILENISLTKRSFTLQLEECFRNVFISLIFGNFLSILCFLFETKTFKNFVNYVRDK